MPSQPVSRRGFIKSAAVGSLVTGAVAQSRSQPPNVILIVADDLGYGDLNCYGSSIPTPNVNALARQGVQFTQYYAASPVCSPSRASLLTGRYAPRTGVPYVLQASDTHGLLPSEVTMAQMLKGAGYHTMC